MIMKKQLLVLLVLAAFLQNTLTAQCSFTAGIVPLGPTNACGSVVLTASPLSNQWTRKANFGGGAGANAVGFSIGTKGYIGTGTINYSASKTFWEYDPATNSWTQKADLAGPGRFSAVGFSIGSKGYIGTGVDGSYAYL